MLVVGLTGGIACGKTTVSNFFSALGAPIIDADYSARQVVIPGSEGLSEIVSQFGNGVLNEAGSLDRVKMRSTIFSDETAKSTLEQILHPKIRRHMDRIISQLEKERHSYCIKSIPLLIETNQQTSVDRVLVVDCKTGIQIARVQERDNCSQDEANTIIATQVSRDLRLACADDVIENNGNLNLLRDRVYELHRQYLHLTEHNI